MISSLKQTCDDERRADVVISTSHKAKGREWDTVELADDFLPSKPDRVTGEVKVDRAELRLFYVALTRARVSIDFSPAIMSQFGIIDGPKFANPRRGQLKQTAAPIVPRQRVTPAPNLRSVAPIRQARPAPSPRPKIDKSGSGVTIPRWVILAGLLILGAFAFG